MLYQENICLMRSTIVGVLLFLSFQGFALDNSAIYGLQQQGKLYFYWGWNWDWYSHTDLHFSGDAYDFILYDVVAEDKPKKFSLGAYFNPAVATIPQYNFRIGYFIKDHYSISFGTDHMKYVVTPDQTTTITGNISNTGTDYDGTYENQPIDLTKDFLRFEHTDGLNYINVDVRRFDNLFAFGKVQVNLTEGIGGGILYPKTNATLLNFENNDEFHLAGYGFSGVVAANVTFFKNFFLQSEFKAGYINMPDIRTTPSAADSASQHFLFYQLNFVLGATIKLGKKNIE